MSFVSVLDGWRCTSKVPIVQDRYHHEKSISETAWARQALQEVSPLIIEERKSVVFRKWLPPDTTGLAVSCPKKVSVNGYCMTGPVN